MILTSRDNQTVQKYQKCRLQKKYRDRFGLFCLEGARLVCDAIKSEAPIEQILVTKNCFERYANLFSDVSLKKSDVTFISEELSRYISDVPSPQGVFALVKKLDKPCDTVTIKGSENYLVLCSMQDPGNLGTVLRVADAMNIERAFLYRCCDVYQPKAVRSSMGALFHLPFSICDDIDSLFKLFSGANVPTIATTLSKDSETVFSLSSNSGGALFIGNEGNGLERDIIDICDMRITIPTPGRAESLNAAIAASICMWELVRDKVWRGTLNE